jgi:hypothetical protein
LRTVANTRHPALNIRKALARPMPLEAPVMTTDFFGEFMIFSSQQHLDGSIGISRPLDATACFDR